MEKRLYIFLTIAIMLVVLRIFWFFYLKPPISTGQSISFITHITSQPKIYNSYQTFGVNLPSGEQVFIKTDANKDYDYSDRVNISGTLNYQLLKSNAKILTMDFPQISLENSRENMILAVVNFIRQQISNTFYTYLPNDLAGLMLGIVIGVKANFSPQFLNYLKVSGVMHVIAASGMNVTMVSGFFFFTFALFLKRKMATALTISIIIFYAFLAGFQPSIIRASIMGVILFLSQIWGRQNYSLYSLVITGLLMLLVWPQFLLDVGFQLSFVATLGLVFIPEVFGRLRDFVSEDLVTTLSAQIATMPILLITFGTYSPWSVVVNFLVLWTIPPLMVLGGLAAILSLVFVPFAKPLLLLALPLLSFFEAVVRFFGSLGQIVTLTSVPVVLVIGYYLILVSILIFLKKRRANL